MNFHSDAARNSSAALTASLRRPLEDGSSIASILLLPARPLRRSWSAASLIPAALHSGRIELVQARYLIKLFSDGSILPTLSLPDFTRSGTPAETYSLGQVRSNSTCRCSKSSISRRTRQGTFSSVRKHSTCSIHRSSTTRMRRSGIRLQEPSPPPVHPCFSSEHHDRFSWR